LSGVVVVNMGLTGTVMDGDSIRAWAYSPPKYNQVKRLKLVVGRGVLNWTIGTIAAAPPKPPIPPMPPGPSAPPSYVSPGEWTLFPLLTFVSR